MSQEKEVALWDTFCQGPVPLHGSGAGENISSQIWHPQSPALWLTDIAALQVSFGFAMLAAGPGTSCALEHGCFVVSCLGYTVVQVP